MPLSCEQNHAFFLGMPFLLGIMTDELRWVSLGNAEDMFSKMNAVSLALQEKQLTIFCAKEKNQACKQKREFYNTCIRHDGPDSFLKRKDSSNEIDGDIYKCGVLIPYNEMVQQFYASTLNQYFPRMT